MNNKIVKLSSHPLSIDEAFNFVNDQLHGGNCLFVGTVRRVTKDYHTQALEFESFDAMAVKEIEKIMLHLEDQYPNIRIYISHRTGHLKPGEIAVVIAVSTPHRSDSFRACEWAIDELKKTVPIWKKEILDDGTFWVNAHP